MNAETLDRCPVPARPKLALDGRRPCHVSFPRHLSQRVVRRAEGQPMVSRQCVTGNLETHSTWLLPLGDPLRDGAFVKVTRPDPALAGAVEGAPVRHRQRTSLQQKRHWPFHRFEPAQRLPNLPDRSLDQCGA